MKLLNKQIEPTPKKTDVERHIVEFYTTNDKDEEIALGRVDLVILKSDLPNLMGVAFRRAPPKCLAATMVKRFRK